MSHKRLALREGRLPRPASREAGFTVAELAISLLVMVILFVAILVLFDFNNKLARTQTHVAEMQQSLRIAQYQMVRNVRMAGRGGLIRGTIDNGIALAVRNNVPDSGDLANIAVGNPASPRIVPGTDVLTIRGVFSSPIYHVNPAGTGRLNLTPAEGQPITGSIEVRSPVETTGVPQDLDALEQALLDNRAEALVLVSPLGGSLYGVVELQPGASAVLARDDNDAPIHIRLNFSVIDGTNTAAYNQLSPGGSFPEGVRSVAYLGILEEYRYYVREQFAIPGDPTSEPIPRLSQARFFPGTEVAWANRPAELRTDIADNILDLQVALGIGNGVDPSAPPATGDQWLYSHPDDDPSLAVWNTNPLAYVRINTLARTPRPEVNYVSAPIAAIEDRVYDEPEEPLTGAERQERRHRRRVLQSIVELRNL